MMKKLMIIVGFSVAVGAAFAAESPVALVFTKASGYEHSIVARKNKPLSFAEERLKAMLEAKGFEVECSKDGTLFDGDLSKYKLFVFFTHGNLLESGKDGQPPMSPAGKQALLDAVKAGTPFVGLHSASTTFVEKNDDPDPYILMVGGAFKGHTWTQDGDATVVDSSFPGLENLKSPETIREEWTMFKHLDPEMRVILALDTQHMDEKKGSAYRKLPRRPAAWVKMYGRGRVFYNSMGQEMPVWDTETFKTLMDAGIDWAVGKTDADLTPNLLELMPKVVTR